MANFAANNENAAADAWKWLMGKLPWLHGILSVLGAILGYFLNGHAIVAFVQWMVRVAGRIAESALLLATVYVTLNNVAHTLVTWVLPSKAIDTLNYLSVVAFSLLPELIVASAIATTLDHWGMALRSKSWRSPAWIWTILYTIPTGTFLFMTVTTLASFVQIEATTSEPAMATGAALTARFLAGWGYSLIEILWATVGKKSYAATLDGLRAMVATQGQELSALKATEEGLRATLLQATQERDGLRSRATELENGLRDAKGTIAILTLEKGQAIGERDDLLSALERVQEELAIWKARATKRESRAMVPAPQQAMEATDSRAMATISPEQRATHREETGYVARDDGATMAITNNQGDTIIATGSPRERIKEAILQATLAGHSLNYQDIATAAQAGYSTVKKYAKELQGEIAREMTAGHRTISVENEKAQ